jgi:PAS domain S-box-containing protein
MLVQNKSAEISSPRFMVRLIFGLLLVNLCMISMAGFIIYRSHQQYATSAGVTTQNLVHVLEENFSGILDQVDAALLNVNDEINRQSAHGKINADILDHLLIKQQDRIPEIDEMRVTDKHGNLLFGKARLPDPEINVNDQKFFNHLQAHNETQLFISNPIRSPTGKQWGLALARRVNNSDGSFAGVVYAFITLDSIRESFSHLNVGTHGIVNLRDGEMNLIVRYPEHESIERSLGKNTLNPPLQALLQSGSVTGTYRVDGVLDNFERTFSYRKLSGIPLYVSVGLASDEYLAEWRNFTFRLEMLVALFLLFTCSAAWFINRGEKRRNSATRSLQVLNRDFLTLLQSTTDFIYFKDKDSRIRFCSQTMADLTGHSSWRDMVGKHDVEIFPEETARIYQEEELPMFRDGTSVINHINPYFDRQGKQRWVSTNKWPVFGEDGKTVVGIFGISRDISEYKLAEISLRESEQRFRNMFHNHSSSMLLIDPDNGTIVDANAAAAKFYGYPEDELRGMAISRINTLTEDEIRLDRQQALEIKRNHFVFPHRLASGEIRTVEVYSTPIDDHEKTLLFSIVYDITERKKVEDALLRSNTDLEQFAYSVSHDMRQPLRAVSGHLQLLKRSLKDKMDDNDRENLNFALDGAQRMDSMIVSLLDYSRVGRKTESKKWMASRIALDEALGYLQPLITETSAKLAINGEWPQVFASRDELTRLFQNLISNAIKFREALQPALVEIDSSVLDHTWRVSVRDHGVGIDPQQMHRLFLFFSRLQSRARFEGTGMGLALCKRIAEHHHGRIWAESEGKDMGSRFVFEVSLLPPIQNENEPVPIQNE